MKSAPNTDPSKGQTNLLWKEIAAAPAGFCHPRSGMLGTLLDDLQRRLPFEEVKRRFGEKMAPTKYQTPAAGLRLQKGEQFGELLRVTHGGNVQEYLIDRWD